MVGAIVLPAVILLNAALWLNDVRTLIENDEQVIHTYQIISHVEKIFSLIQDAESANRGYIITGSESYLEPYYEAVPNISGSAALLDSLTRGDAERHARASLVAGRAMQRIDVLNASLNLRQTEGFDIAREAVLQGTGKRAMDALRVVVTDALSEEERILNEQIAESRRAAERTLITLAIASIISLLLAGALYFLLRQALRKRRAIEHRLTQRSEELESVVRERTLELQVANEELREEVAERTRAEVQLRTSAAELKRTNRELEDFAYIASHDLQEPLRKIQAFGERLEGRYGELIPEDGRDDLRRVRAASLRMRTLVNDLLSYTRLSRQSPKSERLNLNEIVWESIHRLGLSEKLDDGEIEVETLPTIVGDREQFVELFQALISNATKFTQEAPARVRIRVAQSPKAITGDSLANDSITIAVEDNGIGFRQKYADRIFRPFERLHAAGRYEGTGMGLAVARRIIEAHGGLIYPESSPGNGSIFYIALPTTHPISSH